MKQDLRSFASHIHSPPPFSLVLSPSRANAGPGTHSAFLRLLLLLLVHRLRGAIHRLLPAAIIWICNKSMGNV